MIDMSVAATWGNRPLEELNRLIGKRAEMMRKQTVRDCLFATGHTVLRSLKPLVKVAKVSAAALRGSYEIEDTGLTMGQQRKGRDVRAFRPHHAGQKDYRTDIRPIVLWGGGVPKHTVRVYKVTPKDTKHRRTWARNLHKGCWYIAAYNEGVARRYVEKTLQERWVRKYRGLAKASVAAMRAALAQAAQEAPPPAEGEMNVYQAAKKLARATLSHLGDGDALEIRSDLSYGVDALKGGRNAINFALAKAANSIAGYLRHRAKDLLDPSLATPFPEIAKHGSMRK